MTTDERFSDLEARLEARFEARLEILRAKQAELHGELRQARLDRWQDRIEDLELQIHLGVLEGSDRVTKAHSALRHMWDGAQVQLQDTSSDAAEAAQAIQDSMRGACNDLRESLIDAKKTLSR